MLPVMASPRDVPTLEQVVADLRVLRERGLVRLRHTDLPHLRQAAQRADPAAAARGEFGAIEAVIRTAVDNLGGGTLGTAALATFGLGRGNRDMPAPDRRRRAALAYGVSIERFRKYHERIVLEQVAEEILKLAELPAAGPLGHGRAELERQIRLGGEIKGQRFPIVIHIEPVELLQAVDVLVVPANVYLELPQHFKSSIAAAVRRAAALRSADGEILTDVISDELRTWVQAHGHAGLPVAPGTVVPTSPGGMAGQGIRRIYHAAVVVPRPGTNDYDVDLTAIATSVRKVLALARADPLFGDRAARSVAFPLLGAGRGALGAATSFTWLWTALERDMQENGPWDVHFVTRRRVVADLIADRLGAAGAVRAAPG
jgi:O-acetyl-ADP-ribose deacetylase (regulator of RNase III)